MIVKNFLVQSESARRMPWDCPPGFLRYKDSCEPEEYHPSETPQSEDKDANSKGD